MEIKIPLTSAEIKVDNEEVANKGIQVEIKQQL